MAALKQLRLIDPSRTWNIEAPVGAMKFLTCDGARLDDGAFEYEVRADGSVSANAPHRGCVVHRDGRITAAAAAPVAAAAGKHASRQPKPDIQHGLAFLEHVERTFKDSPKVYKDFLAIMKDLRNKSIKTSGVIKRVSELFRGHRELILQFNTFLPTGYTNKEDLDDINHPAYLPPMHNQHAKLKAAASAKPHSSPPPSGLIPEQLRLACYIIGVPRLLFTLRAAIGGDGSWIDVGWASLLLVMVMLADVCAAGGGGCVTVRLPPLRGYSSARRQTDSGGTHGDACRNTIELLAAVADKNRIYKDVGATPLCIASENEISLEKPHGALVPQHVELIVDCSGSMHTLLDATVSGLNTFLLEHRQAAAEREGAIVCGKEHANAQEAKALVGLHTFSTTVRTVWRVPLESAPEVTRETVQPDGLTALHDAVGSTLSPLDETVPRVVCIVTDGHENASKHWDRARVNKLIAKRRNLGWTFVFLAANQDAVAEGTRLGIGAETCCSFTPSLEGIGGGFRAMSTVSMRATCGEEPSFSPAERAMCQDDTLDRSNSFDMCSRDLFPLSPHHYT